MKKGKSRCCLAVGFTVFFWFYHLPANGQDTLFIGRGFEYQSIRNIADIWADTFQGADMERLKLNPAVHFRSIQETGISFPATPKVYWLRFTVRNVAQLPQQLLLEVANPYINTLRLFVEYQDGRVLPSMTTGDALPFVQREICHRHFIFHVQVPTDQYITCYLYADKFGEPIALPAKLYTTEAFIEADQRALLFLFGYFGFMFTFVLLAGIASVFLKKRIYRYYLGYTFSATMTQVSVTGFGYQYLWSFSPVFAHISGYFFSCASLLFMLLMLRYYFHTQKEHPHTDILIRLVTGMVAFFLPFILLAPWMPPVWFTWAIPFGHIVIYCYCAVCIWVPILAYRTDGDTSALWFLFAIVSSLVGATIHNFEIMDYLDHTTLTRHAIKVGLAIDIFVLAILIGRQLQTIRRRNRELTRNVQELKTEAAEALITGQQEERNRLARELHDGISLLLATIRMRLSDARERIRNNHSDLLDPIISDMGKVSEDVRRFTHALAPVHLEQQTLGEAVEDLLFHIRQSVSGLRIVCNPEDFDCADLSFKEKLSVFQTLQELLHNAIKHARADSIMVQVEARKGWYLLSVYDNGTGFDNMVLEHGIGLMNIHARATLLSGKVDIQSTQGEGVRVEFSFPVITLGQ